MTTTISNKNLKATINHKGAELVSLQRTDGTEYIWEGNPDFWGKHSPVLFPIVGTLKNNKYTYEGREYLLGRHGFARDLEFGVVDQTDDSAVFSLVHNEDTLKVYPFKFELQLIYTLEQNKLHIAYKVYNQNDKELLFSIGAHPAIALPGRFEDYSIEMEKREDPLEYFLLDNDLLSDRTQELITEDNQFALNYPLFENDALIFKQLHSDSLTILHNDKAVVAVDFSGFPYLGIWTKQQAPFICIEPWFGHSDSTEATGELIDKEGIQRLAADAVFESVFSITIL